jgi:hypothetical protein
LDESVAILKQINATCQSRLANNATTFACELVRDGQYAAIQPDRSSRALPDKIDLNEVVKKLSTAETVSTLVNHRDCNLDLANFELNSS